ncbi:MAG TPA: tetratricopeptide repeat protein [Terriglobia bacterium]
MRGSLGFAIAALGRLVAPAALALGLALTGLSGLGDQSGRSGPGGIIGAAPSGQLAPAASDLHRTKASVTFNKDVAPIIFKNCASCHHPGESGPFSLLTYQDARKHAAQIAAVTRIRFMPPWLPEPGYGDFVGQRRLTEAEIKLIQQWVDEGAVEGDPGELPPVPKFVEGWQLGKPDLVVATSRDYVLPAEGDHGRDVFRNLIIPGPVPGTRYVKAIEFRPGNLRIFHHANILTDPTESSRRLDGQDGQPGFSGMDLEIESDRFDPDSNFLFWKPGTPPAAESDGIPWRLDRGADLILNLHMRPDGKPEVVRPEVGLYFTDQPPTKFPMLLQLENDGALKIPPGDNHFVVTDDFKLPLDVEVLAIYPHAHYLGKDIQGFATLPAGEKKWLIWIKEWNFDWQGVFRYQQPVFLPKGATLHMRWTYDNSAGNVRNPNHPPRLVVGGNLATDEMSHLWVQVLPVNSADLGVDPRLVLQAAISQHKLEKDPGDWTAHFNLGAALETMGKPQKAIDEYRRVLELRPGDAIARNSLGAALQSLGRTDEAIHEYRQALNARPGDLDAEYNLGSALLSQGKGEQAAGQFQQVLKARPDDPDALANLGRAFAVENRMAEAAAEFESALRIDPQNADAHYDLGRVLAAQGDLPQAAAEFESALRINPDHASAHSDLGTVLAMQGKLAQAVAEYEAALRIDPQLATARDNLERARAQLAKSK